MERHNPHQPATRSPALTSQDSAAATASRLKWFVVSVRAVRGLAAATARRRALIDRDFAFHVDSAANGRVGYLPDIAGRGGQGCVMGADGVVVARLAEKFAEFRPHADERAWRLYLGSEARAYAREAGCEIAAAVAVVAVAAGVSRATVAAGAGELAGGEGPLPGRVRRPGAGRPRAQEAQPGLRPALRGLLEAATRGDPVTAVTWTTLSLRDLERELAALGFRCRKDAVARMLHEAGYSLQGMSRVLEGRQHPDRDAQFRHVNGMIAQFTAAGDPVVSVDAKKKELIGPFARPGRSWRPAGDPVKVRDHDFPDEELGKVVPYGVYDIESVRFFVRGVFCRPEPDVFPVPFLRAI